MKRSTVTVLSLLAAGLVLSTVSFAPAEAGTHWSFTYATRPADIQVWLEADDAYYEDAHYSGYDVYPTVENVVLSVRASRSCYATVYVVDTAGYIHVVYPMSPYDNTYLRGGSVYRFYLADFDFFRFCVEIFVHLFKILRQLLLKFFPLFWGNFLSQNITGTNFFYQYLPPSPNLPLQCQKE